MTRITRFNGEHAFLSNFHPSVIVVDLHAFPTVEHAYQAFKTLDPAQFTAIRDAHTPGQAKRLGQKVTKRPDWEHVKLLIMMAMLAMSPASGAAARPAPPSSASSPRRCCRYPSSRSGPSPTKRSRSWTPTIATRTPESRRCCAPRASSRPRTCWRRLAGTRWRTCGDPCRAPGTRVAEAADRGLPAGLSARLTHFRHPRLNLPGQAKQRPVV
jgi:hypothetical protein